MYFGVLRGMAYVFFFSKYPKFDVNFRNGMENSKKVFDFLDICIGISSCKFSLL